MTQAYPSVHYPDLMGVGEITPHGWHDLISGKPLMRLKAFDGSIDMFMAGGLSKPYRFESPECVRIPKGGLKGLIAPWKHIDQKGAVQDGVSQLDALYDPIEVQADVVCYGRDGVHLHRVVRDVIAAIDAKQTSELGFLTLDEGYWWSDVRWFQGAAQNTVDMGGPSRMHKIPLRLRADNGFWRTYAYTDQFEFTYESLVEDFEYTNPTDLGVNWPQYFYDAEPLADGLMVANGHSAKWAQNLGLGERASVALRKDFTTTTNNQVITLYTDKLPATWYQPNAYNEIWGRCNADPTTDLWDGDGIRARIGAKGFGGFVELSRFNNYVETVMKVEPLLVPPWWGDTWKLVLGYEDNPRLYRLFRNGGQALAHKEKGTGSVMDASHRAAGFGMRGGRKWPNVPANVKKITVGDNTTVAQNGFVQLINPGDQPMHWEATVFGPCSTTRIWDGPGAQEGEYVTVGPLSADQAITVRSDPKLRPAIEMPSSVPLKKNVYRYVTGRFSDAAAIPPKSPGNPVQPYYLKVQIDDGNADSKVLISGVPLRRWPL
ncbi:DUF7257 domain-containing protein [Mycolicibacterium llatzerense]|uniref:DUF7257 domain-containing protein n=2 Tax=Mycolicibacterium llatzerense TaxID=280871 RepID=UPI0021B58DB5|nr:hypothetical protein [Mycolicibacterium llatzerense]